MYFCRPEIFYLAPSELYKCRCWTVRWGKVYLKVLGLVATAHAWINVLEVSYKDYENNKKFYEEKIQTANFFFNRVLPKVESYYLTATSGSKYIMDFKFN